MKKKDISLEKEIINTQKILKKVHIGRWRILAQIQKDIIGQGPHGYDGAGTTQATFWQGYWRWGWPCLIGPHYPGGGFQVYLGNDMSACRGDALKRLM